MMAGNARHRLYVTVSILILLLFLFPFLIAHAAPSSSLTGNKDLRPGELLTLTLTVSGNGQLAAEGELRYDPSKLTFESAASVQSGWILDPPAHGNGSMRFLVYDNTQTKPIGTSTRLITVSFRVKQNLTAGTSVTVTATALNIADGNGDTPLPDATFSLTLSPPKSGDASLASLSVSGTSLTPDFSPDVTDYTAATLPFAVSELALTYKTAHAGATVQLSGNPLKVGSNTVTLTVTAENGVQKVYRIRVEREQDPNYVPSSNSTLSAITLSHGILSPVFDPLRSDYLVILPYEIDKITAGGTPSDPLAIGCSDQSLTLMEGENLLTLVNRAEDGSESTYRIHILRAPKYDTLLPEITPGTEAPAVTDPPDVTDPPETPPVTDPGSSGQTDPVTTAPTQTIPEDSGSSETQTEGQSPEMPEAPSDPGLSILANQNVLIALAATGGVMLGLGLIIGALAAKPRVYTYKAGKR